MAQHEVEFQHQSLFISLQWPILKYFIPLNPQHFANQC